jgi:Flp pilus assembly protein TadD
MRFTDHPRSAFGSPPLGGAASGPAKPDPRRLLGCVGSVRSHLCVLVVVCASVAGCATVSEPLKKIQQTVVDPVVSAVTPAAAVSAPAAAAPAPVAVAKPEPEAPVSPAVQRAYDDARKALRAGRTEDAERGFRALTQSNPELGGPHANLALIYRQAGKLPEAVAALEKAVGANPRQPIYFNQLGIAYRHNGQFDKAREAYEKAIALDPNYASAHLNLAILHDLYLWDGKRALELYDRYLVLSPGGDATVTKWVADLKNRKQSAITVSKKEKE